jgi:hypothetical protein
MGVNFLREFYKTSLPLTNIIYSVANVKNSKMFSFLWKLLQVLHFNSSTFSLRLSV